MVSYPERIRNRAPPAGNPFPADNYLFRVCKYKPRNPMTARYKQNTGRGEGLIYNIPAVYFQMR